MPEWSQVYNLQARWAHWCDLKLAQAWLEYALSLVTDAEEARLDASAPWSEQMERIQAVWQAWGMVYRALNVRPWNERIYRTWWETAYRTFFHVDAALPEMPMHPGTNAFAIDGAYAKVIQDWFKKRQNVAVFTEAEWALGSYPNSQRYVEGYNITRPYPVLCDLGTRIRFDESGNVIAINEFGTCLPQTCPEGLMKDFNRGMEFVPPGTDPPRRDRPASYDWRWIQWKENNPWGVAQTRGCPVGPVSPPALWFFKAAQASLREMKDLGLYTVLDHTFSDVTLRNLLTAENLGVLPDALIDLAERAKLGIHERGSADDQVLVIAYTAQAAGAILAAAGGPFGAVAGAVVSVIGMLAPYVAEAAVPRLSSDVFGRSSPTYEEVDISYDVDNDMKPSLRIPDPPGFVRAQYQVVDVGTSGGKDVRSGTASDSSRATSTGRFSTPGVTTLPGVSLQRFTPTTLAAIQRKAKEVADAAQKQGEAGDGGVSGVGASPEPPFYAKPVFYIPATVVGLGLAGLAIRYAMKD